MNEIEQYVRQVLHNIHAPAPERQRIETDLRAHVQEALAAGETPRAVVDHMGSPTEVAAEFMSQVKLNYAGLLARLAAFLVDLATLALVAAALGMVAVFFMNLVPRQNLNTVDWIFGTLFLAFGVGCTLVAVGSFLIYFPILEGRFGQTLGKRMLGLYVLKEDGLPIGYKEAFLRRIPFYFDFLPLDALFIPFTAKRQRAFDIIARTIVVREQAEPAAQRKALGIIGGLAALCVALFVIQGNMSLCIFWMEQHTPGKVTASYLFFHGTTRDMLQAQAGQQLVLDANATVRNGSLEFTILDPNGNWYWGHTVGAPYDGWVGQMGIPARQTGTYTLVVQGHDTGGSFDISWQER